MGGTMQEFNGGSFALHSIRPDCISLRAESPAKCRAGISAITFTYKLYAVKAGCCNQLGSVGIRSYKECRLTLPNESPPVLGLLGRDTRPGWLPAAFVQQW